MKNPSTGHFISSWAEDARPFEVLFVVAPLMGGAALLYRTIRALDPILQMPQRQAMQALLGETAQRMDRAGAKPTEY